MPMYIGLLQMALAVQGYIFFQNHPPALRSWGGGETRKSATKYQVFSSVILLFTQNVISPIREYNHKKNIHNFWGKFYFQKEDVMIFKELIHN